MVLVLITGKAGSGKDTTGAILHKMLMSAGVSSELFSFAQKLKDEAYNDYGWDGKKDVAGRALLLKIGRERREEDIDYWVKAGYAQVATSYPDVAIFTDTRFKNEISPDTWRYVNTHNLHIDKIITVRIIGNHVTETGGGGGMTEEVRKDPSENDLNDYITDYTIHNVSSLGNLSSNPTIHKVISDVLDVVKLRQ